LIWARTERIAIVSQNFIHQHSLSPKRQTHSPELDIGGRAEARSVNRQRTQRLRGRMPISFLGAGPIRLACRLWEAIETTVPVDRLRLQRQSAVLGPACPSGPGPSEPLINFSRFVQPNNLPSLLNQEPRFHPGVLVMTRALDSRC
jgi:hypothetical protein